MVTNVNGKCSFKSVNYKNEENYKKIETTKLEKKSWFCDVIKVAIGYDGNFKNKNCVQFLCHVKPENFTLH